ncbi:hypothetical protein [Cedecea lapagei]|uniref:hypothetical protein n=1 Tax=Cedecea lapagei TaxID=158823 RepID=UPI000F845AD9|nr:hypothetical protein [Cedecea lapagei]
MKDLLNKIRIFLAATFKVIVVTGILIAIILTPALLPWKLSTNTVLGIISLSLTVLAGTDFVNKNTKVTFKKDGSESDLWLVISIAIAIAGVIAIFKDDKTECIDKVAYGITVLVLSIIVGLSTYKTCKDKKAP